jgi:NNP family nitrate/nitrite transporter-like MFS transporter
MIIVAASVLRVLGGWLADRIGGLRLLEVLAVVIILCTGAAALVPASPWVMVLILIACFSAMGAGNGAVFQLVPLRRFRTTTAVAGSLIGEIGALAGGFLPNAMGLGKQHTGSFTPGSLSGTILALAVVGALLLVTKQWTSSWVGKGGRAREEHPPGAESAAETVRRAA